MNNSTLSPQNKKKQNNINHKTTKATVTQVVVGIIWNQNKTKLLISQRPKTIPSLNSMASKNSKSSLNKPKDFAGFWEFPGGKIEEGEPPLEALKRELNEELTIELTIDDQSVTYLFNTHYQYPHKTVNLLFYNITAFSGTPLGNEGQRLRWVAIQALSEYTFPEANQSILTYLTS